MYKLAFFVPESHIETVKEAAFAAGAGRIGNYEACSWQTLGVGQFRPLEGSDPHIGKRGTLEQVKEWRVEMVCADELIESAIAAMKQAHPYEEVAYDVWRLSDL